LTEADWNTASSLTDNPYSYSKLVAEKAAHEWAKEHPNVRLVVMNPGFICGPINMPRADGESVQMMTTMLNGEKKKKGKVNANMAITDVRDLAKAHIAVFETKSARGRYLVAGDPCSQLAIADILRNHGFGLYDLPSTTDGTPVTPARFSSERAKNEIGFTSMPIEKTVLDMAQSIVELGLVAKKAPH